jgi:predicted RNA binding protein YcfA (HicA-like mRNA interferase family)
MIVRIIIGKENLMTIKPAKMVRILKRNGFIEAPKSGGHRKFIHPDGRRTEVPMHGKELTKFTQDKILKQARIKL